MEAVKEIMVTENGAAFKDTVSGGRVADPERIAFFKEYLGRIAPGAGKKA